MCLGEQIVFFDSDRHRLLVTVVYKAARDGREIVGLLDDQPYACTRAQLERRWVRKERPVPALHQTLA